MFQSQLDDKNGGFEMNLVSIEEDVFSIHVSRKRLVERAKTKVLKKKKKRPIDTFYATTRNKKTMVNEKLFFG